MSILDKKLKTIGQGCLLTILTAACSGYLHAQTYSVTDAVSDSTKLEASAISGYTGGAATARLCSDTKNIEILTATQLNTVGTASGQCGDGKLDPGECCDLGALNGVKSPTDATKSAHGCLLNCVQDKTNDWNCNEPAQLVGGYSLMLNAMNDLFIKLVDFATNNPVCTDADTTNNLTSAGTYDVTQDLNLSASITNCTDYETALSRFKSYNASHALSQATYASKAANIGNLKLNNNAVGGNQATAMDAINNNGIWVQ